MILHALTKAQVDAVLANPTHAILLCGEDGIGKTALAELLLAELLRLTADSLPTHPYYKVVKPEATGSISIEAIRGIQKFLQLKTVGAQSLRRAVLIEHAQGMTIEAQNAFLKLLEEPPADTVIILTTPTPRALLPTIRSRAQSLTVHLPEASQLDPMVAGAGRDEATARQAFFMSNGLPGLLHALLYDEAEHPLVAGVALAKEILQKTPFERLATVDALSKQKDQARAVTEALERIAQAGLGQAAAKQDLAKVTQWHRIHKQAVSARQALAASANAKLTMTNLFLHL